MSLLVPPDYRGPLSTTYVTQVYVPSSLMIAGCAIAKKEWLPFAVAAGLVLFGFTFVISRPMASLDKNKWKKFKLQEKTVISHNVAVYRFALPTKNHILSLPIGQHISVMADIFEEGKTTTVQRSYTPISSDENSGYFDLLIKSYPTGRISKHMGELKIGQSLQVRGPKGAMVYTPNLVRHFGMIAGGTGITPMLQIIRAIIRGRPANGGNDTTEVDLIFANVNPEDILLKDDLDKLAKEDSRFRVHYVLNFPLEGWKGGVGFVTEDMIQKWLPEPADDIKILICGPPPMVNAMKKATEGLKYKPTSKPFSKLHDQVFCF